MRYARNANGGAPLLKRAMKLGGADSVVAGQLVIMDADGPGQVMDPTKTAGADQIGVTLEAGTYSTTQGAEDTVECVVNPYAVYSAQVSGGTGDDEDQALTITENDTADGGGTKIADAGLASDCMIGGLVYALTGNNVGQTRLISSYDSATCLVVTVPFNTTIASGDEFLVFGFAPYVATNLALTTGFTQVPQHQAPGAGIDLTVVDIIVDDLDPAVPTARVYFTLRDHVENPI